MNDPILWRAISDALGFNPAFPPTTDEMVHTIKAMQRMIHAESTVAFELETILSEGYSGRWFDSAHQALHQYQQAINAYAEAMAWGEEPKS